MLEAIIDQRLRFLREDHDGGQEQDKETWDDALARKFYSNLWKEYAVCDLKHYKSGNVSEHAYSNQHSLY
jgi:protein FRA10AC1